MLGGQRPRLTCQHAFHHWVSGTAYRNLGARLISSQSHDPIRRRSRPPTYDPLNSRDYDLDAAAKTYNVSNLILKLDAHESPYVRPFRRRDLKKSKSFKQSWLASGQYDINEDQQQSRRKISEVSYKSKAKRLAEALGNIPYRSKASIIPTKADILAMTLKGYPMSPHTPVTEASAALARMCSDNHIPHQVGSEEESFAMALESITRVMNEQIRSIEDSEAEKVIDTVKKSRSIWELQRLTDLIVRTPAGCRLLVSRSFEVLKVLAELHRDQKLRRGAQLSYVNSLTAAVESKGVEMGAGLCHIGVFCAVNAGMSPAAQHYLRIAITRQYTVSQLLHTAMVRACKPLRPWGLKFEGVYAPVWRPNDVLGLFTGWRNGGVPSSDEERQTCFALTIGSSHSMYCSYILALGKLGANEALQYELQNPDVTPMASHTNMDAGLHNLDIDLKQQQNDLQPTHGTADKLHRLEIFVQAFLYSKDLRSAKQCLKQLLDSEGHTSLRTVQELHPDASDTFILRFSEAYLGKLFNKGNSDFTLKKLIRIILKWIDEQKQSHGGYPPLGIKTADTILSLEDILKVKWIPTNNSEGHHVTGNTEAEHELRP